MSRLPVICLVAVLFAACAPAEDAPAMAPDTSADVAAINALSSGEMDAFTSGDNAAMSRIFSADIQSMPPNAPAIEGLPALLSWADELRAAYTLGGGYDTSEVVVSGDLAVQTMSGTLTMTPVDGGETISENIKAIHVLRKQADGTWRIVQDIWNSSDPLPMDGGGN